MTEWIHSEDKALASRPGVGLLYFVIEKPQGIVKVHVTREALVALGAADDDESLSATLQQQLPRLRALGRQLAGGSRSSEVTIRSGDLWWSFGGR